MKDAKGHGSNKRGGGYDPGPVPQGKAFAARQAMKAANNPNSYERLYGTPMDVARLHAEATNAGVDAGFKSARQAAGLGADRAAASELARGNPKADAAPVHAGASGRSDILAKQIAFTKAAGSDMTPKQRDWLAKNKG